jgi:hypothetical protein
VTDDWRRIEESLYRRIGDGATVQEHLTTAATMYHEMDMGFWLEQAEAALESGAAARGGPTPTGSGQRGER